MIITDTKHYFYIILFITLSIYFVCDILKYKANNYVMQLIQYCKEYNIFEIPFIKIAYNEFKDDITVKSNIEHYEYLNSKKECDDISDVQLETLEKLEKDIELLKISFLSSLIINNKDIASKDLFRKIKKFLSIIKTSFFFKILKILFTIISTVLFFKIMF